MSIEVSENYSSLATKPFFMCYVVCMVCGMYLLFKTIFESEATCTKWPIICNKINFRFAFLLSLLYYAVLVLAI